MSVTIWTAGHSTHSQEEFVELLRKHRIELLVDVRTIPRSRRYPQFNRESLIPALESAGFEYLHCRELGGLRKPRRESVNSGWRNDSFRGYADYMQTADFSGALSALVEQASARRTAIMCAEAVPWRCHRSLIADALVAAGHRALHILSPERASLHHMTPFAAVYEGRLTYPAERQATLFA